MKTLLALAIASTISFSALAADEDLRELSGVSSSFQKINVTLKSEVGNAKISILDQNGKNLSNRKVHMKNTDVVVPFNLSGLPEGEYLVKIATEEEEVIYSVETNERPIPVEDLPLMAYGKAIDENTVNLAVIGLTQPGVKVEIHSSESGKLIYEEYIDQPDAFKKDFSLKGVNCEDIYMELTDSIGRKRVLFF
ncbi:T9SS type A sorting domain-containing protein [Algoriphagus sp.]|uniref:T9SS type A sorting domain-containing protein n=1 Tax=Algoriphagus sp. TaxID=1872435 RepID=UPI0025E21BDC|nr:T9SS type A sorting domain-containing protein [Algoriphagus sp.]